MGTSYKLCSIYHRYMNVYMYMNICNYIKCAEFCHKIELRLLT